MLLLQVQNRLQTELQLLLFDPSAALQQLQGSGQADATVAAVCTLLHERAPRGLWTNLHNMLYLFPPAGDDCRFIWASERSGLSDRIGRCNAWWRACRMVGGRCRTLRRGRR